ncbi:hypothetical protein SUGI_0561360 [Cryptomeria japonica]|nr:hypothetical protein SUGI_0561360 [Cryptomeria japonica]
MDLDIPNLPKFRSGQEFATFTATSGILPKAWEAICSISKNREDSFLLIKDGGVVYVAFPSFHKEDYIVPDSKYGECNIKNCKIFSAGLKGDDAKPAFIHKGALNRFLHILESSDFKAKMQGLKEQTIMFVGHSVGGAVAALATLWFLEKRLRNFNSFCITFGAPLVGNATIQEAIGREDWLGRFCHVVCRYDIVPRMNLAPYDSIAKPLDAIVPQWRSKMGINCDSVSHLSISEARITLINNVLKCTATIPNNYPGEYGLRSPFVPFRTYVFCSTHAAACFEDSETILKLLQFTMQSQEGIPFDQIADTCISEHTDYGHMLEGIDEDLLNAVRFVSNSSVMGIALESEAIGVGTQDNDTLFGLRKAGEVRIEKYMNIEKLNVELRNSMASYMAELEPYEMLCKGNNTAYYDAFKQHDKKKYFRVNLARTKLGEFWDKIVETEEKHVLPSDFRSRDKWINAGTAYRSLVEPLDIAYHYSSEKGNEKSYLSDGVRPHRHIFLEKWLEEYSSGYVEKDSCFWARLKETRKALKNVQQEQETRASMTDCIEFEMYVASMIDDESIPLEVFVEGSSFMIWWQQYCLLRVENYYWRSSSPLYECMMNESWK